MASTSARVTAGSGRVSLSEQDDRVAGDQRRRQPADETQQRRGLRRHDPDHAGRLRDREVEVRRGDRVGRARGPGRSCRPSRRTRPSGRWRGPPRRAPGPVAAPRRPRPPRRTARAGPPSARRPGRGPGRGSSRSWPPSPRTPCARPGPRRGRPCATPGRRWRAARRRRADTTYERPDLGPREGAADVQLVGLADLEPGARAAVATADLRCPPGRRCATPSAVLQPDVGVEAVHPALATEARTPCSRRTARSGRTG